MSLFQFNSAEVIDNLPEALLVTSDKGEIVYVNRALESLMGFTSSDLLGNHVSRLMPAGERAHLDALTWFERWAQNPDAHQLRHLHLDGLTKTAEKLRLRVRVSSFEEKANLYFLVVLQDVTEEYQTTLDLRHAQLISKRIIAIGEDAVLTIDETQSVRFWNLKAEQIFGYKSDEIIGRQIDLLIPDKFSQKHKKYIDGFATGTEASRTMGDRSEIQGLHKDGHVIPLEASITKTTVDGQVLVSAQIRDISERKRNEQLLRSSETRFRAVFENAFEAMALLAPSGRVMEINAAAKKLLPEEDSPKDAFFWELNWWSSDDESSDNKAMDREVDRSMLLKENLARVQSGEKIVRTTARLPTKSGHRSIDFSLIPVKGDDGELAYIIAEGRDLTEIGELE
ncbi:MAG: PAS domain S-box protein [bacterium]|nr:PAS domain S-box protein [Gammaproteobacteria bacterium]HIL98068.1 PAS domain S-box protein [Pseudomonadales bacterium]